MKRSCFHEGRKEHFNQVPSFEIEWEAFVSCINRNYSHSFVKLLVDYMYVLPKLSQLIHQNLQTVLRREVKFYIHC